MGLPSRRMSSSALRIWLWSWLSQNVSSCMVWMLLFWPGRQRAKSDTKGWGRRGGGGGGGGLCQTQVQTSLCPGSPHLEVQGTQALGQGCWDILQLVIGQMEKLQLLQVLWEEARDEPPCSQPRSGLCISPITPWCGRFGLKPVWIHPPGWQPQHPPGKLRAGGRCWGSC